MTNNDIRENFFSKIGGMVGLERAYDFHELVNTINTLKQRVGIESINNGLKFSRMHNKMENMWESLHCFDEDEEPYHLIDYSLVAMRRTWSML